MISPGSLIGPYTVLATIGAGGMGEVYRARDTRLGRDVAVKLLRRSVLDEAETLDRLLREASLASSLNHPNIVTIYDTGTVSDDRYVVMELIEGPTLRQLGAQRVAIERGIAIARQVAEALAVAHAAGIVHRDIKPDNVMIRPDGYVKLLDFGLARGQARAAGGAEDTSPGMLLGTVGYMSPEQARGERAAPEADIFTFGIVLYELLAGVHPFASPSQMGTIQALMLETPAAPSTHNPAVPRPIDELVMEMLHKDAAQRPGAGEVLLRLGLVHDAAVSAALSAASLLPRSALPAQAVVGRDDEIQALLDEFDRAQNGRGRLVLVSGEAGSGKTTLVDAFFRGLADAGQAVRVGRGRCSERLAGSEAYLPVIEALEHLLRQDAAGSFAAMIASVAPTWFAQIAPPAGNDPGAARLAAETAAGSQERLKREISALLEDASRAHPLVLWLDDVQWADPSTTDLLSYVVQRLDGARTMIIATARPSELTQSRHPMLAVTLDLQARGRCREIIPGPVDTDGVARYIALQFPGNEFPDGFAALVHDRTEGHPMFFADLLREMVRRQVIREEQGRWVVAEDLSELERELPQSVRSLVQRKMDALDDADRRVLGAASLLGMDFDSLLLVRALSLPEEELEDRLDRLEKAHALVRFLDEVELEDRTLTLRYRFAHNLYQNAFYDSLRATRRASYGRALAEQLVRRPVASPSEAASVALLFEMARDNIRAAEYFNRAGVAAGRLYAHEESARLAEHGLALLAGEPPSTPRNAAELSLQMTLGLAAKTGRGYAVREVGVAYARARELSRQVDDPARVVPALLGLSAHHIVSGEIETSREVAIEMLDLFTRLGDPNLQMVGEWSLGTAVFHLGDLNAAHEHLVRALSMYDPVFHQPRVWETGIEPGVFCRCELSRTLLLRGSPDQALAQVTEAVAHARALEHPQPLAFALLFLALTQMGRREPRGVLATYEALEALCRTHGIAQELQWAGPLAGRARVELGDIDSGLREMEESLAAHTMTRSALLRPYYFGLYAGALMRGRRLDAVQAALDEGVRAMEDTAQRAYAAEFLRLQADLHVARDEDVEAEAQYREALRAASSQGARWLELRAARGLANLLSRTGRPTEARAVLAPVVSGIEEGHDILDYVYADGLLKNL